MCQLLSERRESEKPQLVLVYQYCGKLVLKQFEIFRILYLLKKSQILTTLFCISMAASLEVGQEVQLCDFSIHME